MLRPLTSADLPAVVRLAPMFWAEGKLPGKFVPEVFLRTWESLFSLGIGQMIGSFDGDRVTGVLGFILSPDANDGEIVATEMFWFVDPASRGDGLRLFRAFETEAKAAGAKRLIMVHLSSINGPELKHLYERCGYHEIETQYLKDIST